jgi:ABC-type dipeptide/oligopeptide/nickel transport system permease subunit
MDVVAVTAVVLLVLGAVWAGDWLRRAIDDYQNDENHK